MAGTSFKGPIQFGPEVNSKLYPYRSGIGMFDSAEFFTFFDDFVETEESNELGSKGWSSTTGDGGYTIVNGDAHGGTLVISSDGANEGQSFYLPKCIKLTGKKFFMEVRVKATDVDDCDIQFGLTDLSASTNPEDLWDTSNADGAAGGVLDGAATVGLVYDKGNTGPVTETGSISLADNTFAVLGLAYNGSTDPVDNSLKLYVNGVESAAAGTNAQIPETVVLAPFFGARTGSAASDVITFDYFRFSVER